VVADRAGCGRQGRVGATWEKNARAAADWDAGERRGGRTRGLRPRRARRSDVVEGCAGRGSEERVGEFVRVRTIAGRAGWLAGRDLGAGGDLSAGGEQGGRGARVAVVPPGAACLGSAADLGAERVPLDAGAVHVEKVCRPTEPWEHAGDVAFAAHVMAPDRSRERETNTALTTPPIDSSARAQCLVVATGGVRSATSRLELARERQERSGQPESASSIEGHYGRHSALSSSSIAPKGSALTTASSRYVAATTHHPRSHRNTSSVRSSGSTSQAWAISSRA